MSTISLVIFLLVVITLKVYEAIKIQGDKSGPRILPRVYMVEFESNSIHLDHKMTIRDHLELIGFRDEHISFRTSTKTSLFHGHSFEVKGNYDDSVFEGHIVRMPGVINIHRVLISCIR